MKPYTGSSEDRCPDMGGKLCSKVCPSCKFQQEFTMTDKITGSTKVIWECAKVMQTQLLMEGNQIGIDGKKATDQLRKEAFKPHIIALEDARQLESDTPQIPYQLSNGAERSGN